MTTNPSCPLLDHDIPERIEAARQERNELYDRYAGPCDYPPNRIVQRPEYQQLNGQICDERLQLAMWREIVALLASARDTLQARAKSLKAGEQHDLLAGAVKELGPKLGKAKALLDASENRVNALKQQAVEFVRQAEREGL
jgi:hypothetical protein